MKKILAFILVLVLALSLVACNKGGETPNGDNATPGTVTETPNSGDTTTPNTSGNAPAKKDFAWLDPSMYDMEKKAEVDSLIAYHGGNDIDIDKLIAEVFDEYSEFINENITLESIRTVITVSRRLTEYKDNRNLTKLPGNSLQKVNDYLTSNGAEPLDPANHKQDIAALAIAVSLNYKTNRNDYGYSLYDLARAFHFAYGETDNVEVGVIQGGFMTNYYVLLDE